MEKPKKTSAGVSALWKEYLHITLLFVLCSVLLLTRKKAEERFLEVFSEKDRDKKTVIVIDAGHGGADPGKVGATGTLEKEINLAVAKKAAQLLEEDGYIVVLTREDDVGLYPAGSENKKRDDMKERVRKITEADPALVVSIHQNSYPAAACKGAQMFYYRTSAEGKELARVMQESFLEVLQDGNRRKEKANSDYYLLRKAPCPIVIAECGFLSTPEEEALLVTEEYQEKLAQAIRAGIRKYFGVSPKGRIKIYEDEDSKNSPGLTTGGSAS